MSGHCTKGTIMVSSLEKAPVLNGSGEPLATTEASVAGTSAAVFTTAVEDGIHYVVGQGPGTATLNATRTSDGAQAAVEVTVTAVPFSISIGTPVPK
jgi:hypothetical protein